MFDIQKTWSDARSDCLSKGGDLSSFVSYEQQMKEMPATGGYWLGFNDIDAEGQWKWSNGEPSTWTNWKHPEPNNAGSNEHCLRVYMGQHKGKWLDTRCNERVAYVCKGYCK